MLSAAVPLHMGLNGAGECGGVIWVVGFNDLLPRFVGVKITHGVEYSCDKTFIPGRPGWEPHPTTMHMTRGWMQGENFQVCSGLFTHTHV